MNPDSNISTELAVESDGLETSAISPPQIRAIGSREFVSTLVTNLVIQACTIVQGILVARLLGPVGRGQFAAAILWPTLFAGVTGLGVGVALARRAGRATDLARVIRTGLVLTLFTGALGAILCAIAIPWLLPGADAVVRKAAYAYVPIVICSHVSLALIAIDQGAGWFSRMNWTRLIVNPIYLAFVIVLWLAKIRDVFWFVISLLIASGAVALARVGMALRHAPLPGPLEPVKSVFREALPFGFAGLLTPITQTADKALLLYLLGTTQLGFYTVALTAASIVNSLAGAAGTVSFGMSTQVKDREGFDRIARMFRFTAWTWLLAGLAVAVIIPIMLPLLYGLAFRPAIWPAILLIPAAAFTGQASILEESMRAQGRAFIGLEARAAGLVVMIAVGWLLAPALGIFGVVLAAIVSQAIVLIVMMFAARWHFHRAMLNALCPRLSDLLELKRRVLPV
ncbi:MAG TPA: oligosaccharide flippase family protein [Candidatus Udaeobacter sp.]|nr:oligosaccharide flippase family protein [Candidatus Udaeobacter sp.]